MPWASDTTTRRRRDPSRPFFREKEWKKKKLYATTTRNERELLLLRRRRYVCSRRRAALKVRVAVAAASMKNIIIMYNVERAGGPVDTPQSTVLCFARAKYIIICITILLLLFRLVWKSVCRVGPRGAVVLHYGSRRAAGRDNWLTWLDRRRTHQRRRMALAARATSLPPSPMAAALSPPQPLYSHTRRIRNLQEEEAEEGYVAAAIVTRR